MVNLWMGLNYIPMRQTLIGVVLAGVKIGALRRAAPGGSRIPGAAQQVAMMGLPYWCPEPEVNWNL